VTTSSSPTVHPTTIPGPDPNPHPPRIPFPEGACDSHAHMFGPQEAFPYMPNARFISPDALTQDYIKMLGTIGCQRAVLVQPSNYGSDNRCMVAALTSGTFDFRGVAVIDEGISVKNLELLHRAGVRGARITMGSTAAAPRIAELIKPFGWHLQFWVRIGQSPEVEQFISRSPVTCVIDHFGLIRASEGIRSQEFTVLHRLARMKHVWVKLTGPYRISRLWPLHPDVPPFVEALLAAAPDRCVWGTDWPHTNTDYVPNDGDLADLIEVWLPDPETRHRVLVDNPRRLYDFDQ
jgi:2-pyrone-4,6-dicarboxylate lactonase